MTTIRPFLIAALMLSHPVAHAASFDCNKGRSLTEKMICNDPALSKLDDTLGQLYWTARRRVGNRRAFVADSDGKWVWREANCRDAACLGTWYAARIEELQTLIDRMQTGTPLPSFAPFEPDTRRSPLSAPVRPAVLVMRQCTAANPGIVVSEQCSSVLKETSGEWQRQWQRPRQRQPQGGDWFCGVAMLAPAELQGDAAQ